MTEKIFTMEERKAVLAHQVASLVAQGYLIESRGLTNATLVSGRLLKHRELAAVDEWGRVSLTKFPPRREDILKLVFIGTVPVVVVIAAILRVVLIQ